MKYEDFKVRMKVMEKERGRKQVEPLSVDLFDYDHIRPRIFYRVESTKGKEEMMEQCPHVLFDNMMIVFRWLYSQDEERIASARIEWNHLENWGVTEEELVDTAIRNTPRLFPHKISRLIDMIRQHVELGGPDLPVYVLTNRVNINGACTMFYSNILKEIGDDLEQDFYILPSSIHEVLLIGEKESCPVKELYEMVWDANHSVVSEKEFLSNHVYYYCRENDEITLVPK